MQNLLRTKYTNYLQHIFLALVLFLESCASVPKFNPTKLPKRDLIEQTEYFDHFKPPGSFQEMEGKLNKFKKALEKNKLDKNDWKLHDELLDYYIYLKKISSSKVTVPARSRLTLPLETYCLNAGLAAPSSHEIYHWQKSIPNIKYYSDLLSLRRKGEIEQDDLQELLWNLGNETRWENYPEKYRAILLKIDANAALKLPSEIKDQAADAVKNMLWEIPGISEAFDTYDLVKGKYYTFQDISRAIESVSSEYELGDYDQLAQIPETKLYSQSQSLGFGEQEVTFYNPTDEEQILDLAQYHLVPHRKDIQRIGINPYISKNPSFLNNLEKTLYEDMLRLGIGFTPLINDAVDLYEFLVGKDFISSKDLTAFERILSGVGIIVGSGAAYRYAKKAIHAPVKYIGDFASGLGKAVKREVQLSQNLLNNAKRKLRYSNRIIDSARRLRAKTKDKVMSFANSFRRNPKTLDEIDDITENITKSKAFKSAIDDAPVNKAMFYVKDSGEAIPSTGYKYIDSKSPDLQKILSDGHMPARTSSKPHYGSFNKYNNTNDAVDGLQLAKKPDKTPWNDARYRVEFDTLQHIDEIKIPRGKWGDADYLEPLTKDYPEFGKGGATQIIFESKTKIKEVIDLQTGKIVFPKK